MKIKSGVILAGLHLKMRPALLNADRIWWEHGQELVVTSGLEGEHSAGSWHYYGLAVDFRTRYFEDDVKQQVFEALVKSLLDDDNFTVVFKASPPHIHVQYELRQSSATLTWF